MRFINFRRFIFITIYTFAHPAIANTIWTDVNRQSGAINNISIDSCIATTTSKYKDGTVLTRREALSGLRCEIIEDNRGFGLLCKQEGSPIIGYEESLNTGKLSKTDAFVIGNSATLSRAEANRFKPIIEKLASQCQGRQLTRQAEVAEIGRRARQADEERSDASRRERNRSSTNISSGRGGIRSVEDRDKGNYRVTCNEGSNEFLIGERSINGCTSWCARSADGNSVCSCNINTVAANYCR